ncbi:uncharacterized protein LOC131880422 isoform X2 [Tigriopus californicus]|uniref:uncharacterized protein LOC131880422 isoform X2 n=1 Tax=Tigriopus californicus TaxID=6832 RepID=UPI0027DAA507|nr:uncharacterized protein LOC131880422 isoform X2 [Tigriopus californicus]
MDCATTNGVLIGVAIYASVLTAAVIFAVGYLWYRRKKIRDSVEERSRREHWERQPGRGPNALEDKRASVSSSASFPSEVSLKSYSKLTAQIVAPLDTKVKVDLVEDRSGGGHRRQPSANSFLSARSDSFDLNSALQYEERYASPISSSTSSDTIYNDVNEDIIVQKREPVPRPDSLLSVKSQEFHDSIEYDSETIRRQTDNNSTSLSSSGSSSESSVSPPQERKPKAQAPIPPPRSILKKGPDTSGEPSTMSDHSVLPQQSTSSSSSSSDEEPLRTDKRAKAKISFQEAQNIYIPPKTESSPSSSNSSTSSEGEHDHGGVYSFGDDPGESVDDVTPEDPIPSTSWKSPASTELMNPLAHLNDPGSLNDLKDEMDGSVLGRIQRVFRQDSSSSELSSTSSYSSSSSSSSSVVLKSREHVSAVTIHPQRHENIDNEVQTLENIKERMEQSLKRQSSTSSSGSKSSASSTRGFGSFSSQTTVFEEHFEKDHQIPKLMKPVNRQSEIMYSSSESESSTSRSKKSSMIDRIKKNVGWNQNNSQQGIASSSSSDDSRLKKRHIFGELTRRGSSSSSASDCKSPNLSTIRLGVPSIPLCVPEMSTDSSTDEDQANYNIPSSPSYQGKGKLEARDIPLEKSPAKTRQLVILIQL